MHLGGGREGSEREGPTVWEEAGVGVQLTSKTVVVNVCDSAPAACCCVPLCCVALKAVAILVVPVGVSQAVADFFDT